MHLETKEPHVICSYNILFSYKNRTDGRIATPPKGSDGHMPNFLASPVDLIGISGLYFNMHFSDRFWITNSVFCVVFNNLFSLTQFFFYKNRKEYILFLFVQSKFIIIVEFCFVFFILKTTICGMSKSISSILFTYKNFTFYWFKALLRV